jgi:hypothetical protein
MIDVSSIHNQANEIDQVLPILLNYIAPETTLAMPSVIVTVIGALLVFRYIGPETILPLTSAIAAVVGTLLIFWRHVVSLFKKIVRFISRKSYPKSDG